MLAFACAFTMFAGAASFTDQADINTDNVEAVDLLTTLGIIKGYEDGSFDPEGTVDRAEMAKMIYTIRNGGNDDASAHVGNTTSFTDISGHWAEGYIKYLQNTGIVAGKSATKFDPDSQVTTVEAMKMALALTGYDEKNAGLTGIDWEKNTLSYATTIGLTDDVASAMRSGCARQDAAQILANCLGATAVRYSAVVENFVNDSKTGLSFGGDPISVGYKWMDLCTNIGTLVGIDGDKLTITMTQSDAADSDIPSIKQFIDLDTDYSDLLGQKVKVLFNDGKNNEVIGVYATVDNTVYTVEANDTSKDDDKVSFGGESYRLDDEGRIRTYIDGSSTPIWTSLDELDHNALNPNMYTFVDTDDNGRLDTLVVRTYEVAKASYVASDRIIAHGYTYETDDNTVADDIAQNDWVVITKDLYNDNYSIVKADVQTATLDAMRDNRNKDIHYDDQALVNGVDYSEYQIGDNWYNGSDDADAKVVQSNRSENDLHAVRAGESVDYVAVNGIMFYVQRSSGDFNGKVDNVAMILKKDATDISDRARIQLFNGDTEAVEVAARTGDISFDDLQEGVLYEYSVSGGKYYFETIKEGVANDRYEEYYGDLTFRGYQVEGDDYTDDVQENPNTKAKFDDVTIDDKAEVMLFSVQDNGEIKVATMTGKQYKALDMTDIVDNGRNKKTLADSTSATSPIEKSMVIDGVDYQNDIVAYAFSGKLGGLNRIGALAIQVDDEADLDALTYDSWNNYGYILTDAKFVNNNNKTMTYTIWTGTEAIEVQEDYNDLDQRLKGTLIGFNDLERGDVNVIDDVDMLTYGSVSFDAVTDVSNDEENVIFANGGEKDISDATIMFVDSDKGEGFAADEVNGIKTAIKDNNGDYLANALYYTDNNGDIVLVVFDTVDWMHNGIYDGKLPDNDVIYGDDAVWDEDDQKDDGVIIDRNFTFDSDSELVKYTNAELVNGDVRVGLDIADGVIFDYSITVNKIQEVKSTWEGGAESIRTTGANVDADSTVVVTISNVRMADNASADAINNALKTGEEVTINSTEAAVNVTVPANGTLKMDPAGTYAAGTEVTVAAGGKLEVTEKNSASSSTLVGPENARIVPEDGTEVTFTFDVDGSTDKLADMTINGDATIAAGQIWYAMLGPNAADATGLEMTVENGTLTVAGELNLIKGQNGSKLTVGTDGAVVVAENGKITVSSMASVDGNNKLTGTNATSELVVAAAKGSESINNVAGVSGHSAETYTWSTTDLEWTAD